MQCRADVDGDEFVINGQKIWTSGAYQSDWGMMLARTDRNAPKHQGISCIMIDMNAPGVEVRPLKQISGSQEFCEVFFSNVRVPADNLVGEMNAGWRIAQTTLGYERGGNALSRVSRLLQSYDRLSRSCKSCVLTERERLKIRSFGRSWDRSTLRSRYCATPRCAS